jgi:hypothetical protein
MVFYSQGNRIINFEAVAVVDKQSENPWDVIVVMVNGKELRLYGEEAQAFWKSFAANSLPSK